MTRIIQAVIGVGVLVGIFLAGYILLVRPYNPSPRIETPQGTNRVFFSYEERAAFASIVSTLQKNGEIREAGKVQRYEKGVATYKTNGVWDFRFVVDYPDKTRQVIFNDYQDTPDHAWTKVVD